MSDYISREAAKRALKYLLNDSTVDCACKLIDIVPAADVEPVRHGRWERSIFADGFKRCSVCSSVWSRTSNYCPNCGAKMDLEVGNDN